MSIRKALWLAIVMILSQNLAQAQMKVSAGSLDSLSFQSEYAEGRTVYVWKPSVYNESTKFSVIYMYVWNSSGSKIYETCEAIMSKSYIMPFIVVGIPANDKTLSDRYLKFIVKEIKPYIDTHYSVETDAVHTCIAGSSQGGVRAVYAHCEYPQVFGKSISMSPQWSDASIEYLEKHIPQSGDGHIFYFDRGTKDSDKSLWSSQLLVNRAMRKHYYHSGKNFISKTFRGAHPTDSAWTDRLNIALDFTMKERWPER